jgi:pyruvate dehydrogenase E2 component (dihydrolipoamide acetyltransferase)
MATNVVMPKLSLTMKTGTVGKWYKKEGDSVEKGEPLVEVFSEKATYDLEAPASGILRKIIAEEGVDVPVNATLGIISSADETVPKTETPEEACVNTSSEAEKKVPASPAAKRLAREHGIDLSAVKGSGPEGRISEEDVERFMQQASGAAPRIKQSVQLTGFRKTSADRLSLSFKTAPHSTIFMDVDFSSAKSLHEKTQLSYTAILVRAVAKALAEHPWINSTLQGDQIRVFEDINVGVATATENGLVVPVIRNADRRSLNEIEAVLRELTEKARQGRLSKEEVSCGTFTITNLGMYGVDFFTPIINPPEAAILGVGRIADKLMMVNGNVELVPVVTLSLSYDHRIVDGAPAGKFLQNVKKKVEEEVSLE